MKCLKFFIACSVILLFYIMSTRPYEVEPFDVNVKPSEPIVGEITDAHIQTGIGERVSMNIDVGLKKIRARKKQEITKIVDLTNEYDVFINNKDVASLQSLKTNGLILKDPDLDQHISTSITTINDINRLKSNIETEKVKKNRIKRDGIVLDNIKLALSKNSKKVDLSTHLYTRLHFYPDFESMISKLLTNSKLSECKDKDYVCYSKYKD